MKSVFGGLDRVRVFVSVVVVVAAGVVAMPAAQADTVVGCDTPGLIAAINTANTAGSGTLDLTAGCTYKLTSADPSTYGLPIISGNVTIHANDATIKRGAAAPSFGLIYVTGTLAMDHVTLTGGSAGEGGAIDNHLGAVTLSNSTVSDNLAGRGGGIENNSGTLTLTNTTVSGNNAYIDTGGGIYNKGGPVTLTNSTVADNTAVYGGGIFNSGTLTLTSSTVSANTSNGSGGGISNYGSTVTLTNSILSGNTAASGGGGSGGGIEIAAGTVSFTDTTVSGNSSSYGGGIENDDATVTITNSTVSDNTATNPGGGINNVFAGGGSTTVASSIVSGNAGGNCAVAGGSVTSGGYNLDDDGTCGLRANSDRNLLDPLLGPLQGNGGPTETMAPSSASPVVDVIPKGTNGCGTTIATDQRGVTRPQGARCDIGAYETGDIAMHALAAKPKSVVSGAKVTYTATVVNAGAVDASGVTVADTLPKGLTFVSAQASLGSCSFVAPTLTCTLFDQFPAAGTATVKITAKVTAAAGKKITDTATVSATTGDTIPTNNTQTAKINVT